jgi:hypothetical protein
VIQSGKRSTLCTLVAVAALTISGNALAQNPPAPAPTPTPTPTDPAPANDPNNPPANPPATAPSPAPMPPPAAQPAPPPAPESPKTTFPTMAGPMLRLSELFAIRPGMFLQFWSTLQQDQIPRPSGDSGQFAKNFYLRRARFYLLGTIAKNITWFLLWESANLGLAGGLNADGTVNKNYTQLPGAATAYGFNDAWMDFKINNSLSIQGGLFLIPFTRNILQSTATYWALDIGAVSAQYIGVTQTNILRDMGVQAKINAAGGKFEARAMVSQGVKLPEPLGGGRLNGKNDPRITGFLQYNFFEPDAGYVFNGMYFGRKKIAGVAIGADYQSINGNNPYFATSATLFAAIPTKGADPKNGGDEVGGQVEYLHYHGGGAAPGSQVSALGKRDAVLAEAGYYNKKSKFSVFGKFEGLWHEGLPGLGTMFSKVLNSRVYGFGAKYFIAEAICNLTLLYSFTQFPDQPQDMPPSLPPGIPLRHDAHALQLQLQLGAF